MLHPWLESGNCQSGSWKTISSGSFGNYALGTNNTNYIAVTDGIVVSYATVPSGSVRSCHLAGYTDSSSIPSTLVAYDIGVDNGGSGYAMPQSSSVTFPVKKGDSWRISATGTCNVPYIRWVPCS